MDLPVRILLEAPREPVLSVDGAFDAPGLNLSHWPGNRTPASLRHDLSTGSALAFARLPQEERERLAAGATAIVNNHFDTDGLCAAFAVRYPARALELEGPLLDAAACGDFFRYPSDEALAFDAIVTAFADPDRSPLGASLRELPDAERYTRAQHALLERLPDLLGPPSEAGLAEYAPLWRDVVAAARADRADLEAAEREDVEALDLTLWTAEDGRGSSRPDSQGLFDPGRHALFGTSRADRVLAVGPIAGGTSYRLIVSTLSWFDLVTEQRLPRPDLEALADDLNRLEDTRPSDDLAWRAQPRRNPSPELWFGGREQASFAEHNPALAPSELEPDTVLAAIEAALPSRGQAHAND